MASLSVRILGGFSIDSAGSPILVPSERQRSLLVYLALHRNAAQPRQQIAFLFWPDSSEEQALANLRRELSKLRREHPKIVQLLHIGRQTLAWAGEGFAALDVAQFEDWLDSAGSALSHSRRDHERNALQQAVDLYAGPLFPESYDEWVLTQRERLEQRFVQALARLILLDEEALAYDTAIHAAQRLLRHDPLREDTYRQIMRLYALNGDRAQALRAYQECARMLIRELDVEPDMETEVLYQRLLQSGKTLTVQPSPSEQPVIRSKLIGRDNEWRAMLALWRQAIRRGPHLLLINGEAGMGKSRLAEELFEWVRRQGLAAAHGRAYAAEGEMAYAPIIQWLRGESLRPGLSRLDPVWQTEVARLLPELLVEYPDLRHPEPLTESWQRRRLMEGLARACTIDGQPRLLWLDDLQWCDEETLTWLRFFLRFDPTLPVLIVGTVRPQEIDADHPLNQLTAGLGAEDQLTQLALAPLAADGVAALAAQELGHALDEEMAARLVAETAGNPLFVVESVRAGLDTPDSDGNSTNYSPGLPPKVYDVIRSRLARLSAGARLLAELAAVIGRDFTYQTLNAVSATGEDNLVTALDELWRRGIVREQGRDAYDFSHDRIRDVAYADISPVRRPHLHRQIAAGLEALHADNVDSVAARLAVHNAQGGNGKAAIGYYRQAAAVATDRLANTEALSLLRSALILLNELPQADKQQQAKLAVMLDILDLLPKTMGWPPDATLPIGTEALQLAREIGSRWQLCLVLSHMRSYFGMRGQHREALAYAQEALDIVRTLDDDPASPTVATALNSVAVTYLRMGDLTAAHEHYLLGASGQASGHSFHVLALWLLGYADQSRRTIDENYAASQNTHFQRAIVLTTSLQVGYGMRSLVTIQQQAPRLAALADRYEMSFWQAAAALYLGWVAFHAGDQPTGIRQMEEGIRGMDSAGAGVLTLFISPLAEAYGMAGRFDDAHATLDRAFERAHSGDERLWYAELQRLRGEFLLTQGASAQEVEPWFRQALATASQQRAKSLELRAAISLCHLWRDEGRLHEAKKILRPIYGWFSEGFDSADLIEAGRLLEQ